MFQQQDLQGLGSEARASVLALTSRMTLINPLDHTEFFSFFFSISKIRCAELMPMLPVSAVEGYEESLIFMGIHKYNF